MDKQELIALAERVEKLEGPCRETDYLIADAVLRPVKPPYRRGHCERYTASIDAAMTLVPADHTVQLSDWEDEKLREHGAWQAIVLPRGARGRMTDYTFSNRCDHAATPALALCAASLRAIASQSGEGE